ncbi:MAG: hypothetical protein ABI824_09975 [Acidobacteriota bacterium]
MSIRRLSVSILVFGALLAAPLFSQALLMSPTPSAEQTQAKPALADPIAKAGELDWFSLNESRADIRRILGSPKTVEPLGDLESWQYQFGSDENEENSHVLVFRKSTGQLVCVTRMFTPERAVDEWFPLETVQVKAFPDDPHYKVRIRKLSGDRILIAMGSSAPGQVVEQIILIRASELKNFHPWIELK